eukprot:UN10619
MSFHQSFIFITPQICVCNRILASLNNFTLYCDESSIFFHEENVKTDDSSFTGTFSKAG